MAQFASRLAALEKAAGVGSFAKSGTLEYHMSNGSNDPRVFVCDKRADPDHGPDCVYRVAMHTNDGTRFMRIYGFDPAALD